MQVERRAKRPRLDDEAAPASGARGGGSQPEVGACVQEVRKSELP